MSTYSNTYAQKMFAEHPLGLWSLDEDTHFLSAIQNTDRDFSNWSRSGISAEAFSMQDADIFPYAKLGTDVNKIYATGYTGDSSFVLTSNSTFSIDGVGETFTVGFYYFKQTPFLKSVEIGYRVGTSDPVYSSVIPTTDFYKWGFVSATFNSAITNGKIVLKFNVSVPSGSTGILDVLINGITGGIWCEEHNMDYLGAVSEALPTYIEDITGNTLGVKAQKYASDEGYGYYIIGTDGKLSARNASMPMVYGAYNSTILRPGVNGEPSVIVPGNGFLLDSDKFKAKTFEGWFRIDATTTALRRIVGPISTTDGLYVTGPFLMLKIGKTYKSYFVGEWNRPMLIHISTSATSAQVLVNGDLAISMPVDMASETLADISIDGVGPVNDWIGIYAYDDVPVVEVDCIAVYPYQVDTIIAQRRFVLGEAVKFPESLVTAYGGQSIVPDYSFAEYDFDQSYGSNQKSDWNQGTGYNFDLSSGPLKSPVHKLPTIQNADGILESKYYTDLGNYLHVEGIYPITPYFTMKPETIGTAYDNGSHIFFEKLDTINDVRMLYVIGQSVEYSSSAQTIFKIYNQQTGDYIKAIIISTEANKNVIKYISKIGSDTETLYTTSASFTNSSKFVAGIHLDKMSAYPDVSNFLANRSQLKVYVSSQQDYSELFLGKIFSVNFGEEYNTSLIADEFTDFGFFESQGSTTNILSHKSSYGFIPFIPFNELPVGVEQLYVVPEISTSSYWKEDIPLSYFAKKVLNDDGTDKYSLELIQVNFDYAHPLTYTEDNIHDTTDSLIKTYVTFQRNLGTISSVDSFATTYGTPDDYYVDINDNWGNAKYEVVNGSVIGVPNTYGVDLMELSIVVHVKADVPNSLNYPVSMRSLQLSSKTMNMLSASPIKIGTKFAVDLIPFGYDSNGYNPVVITKGSDPYYYLSDQSGLKIAGPITTDRGYYANINAGESDSFNIGGVQTTFKIDSDTMVDGSVRLFSISKSLEDNDLRFYLEPVNNDNTRGRIVAKLYDGTSESNYAELEYFIDGSFAHDPVITTEEWVTVGINFTSLYSDADLLVPTIVNFNGVAGRFNFYASMLINNFSYFQLKKTQEEQRQLVSRNWAEVEYTAGATPTINTWQDWKDETPPSPYKWSDLIQTAEESEITGLNAQELFQSFIGANNIVFETETSKIKPNKFRYDVHSNFVTTSIVLSAL